MTQPCSPPACPCGWFFYACCLAGPAWWRSLAVNMTHSVNATLFKDRVKFDLSKDLKPVAFLAGSPVLVVVPASSPIRTLQDLVDAAKKKPLNAGSSGLGTPSHLSLALFNQLNGTSIQHIPYKGGSPCLADLIAGQLDVIFSNFPESIPFVKAGKLRAIAIATDQRNAQVPDVPTTGEVVQAAGITAD